MFVYLNLRFHFSEEEESDLMEHGASTERSAAVRGSHSATDTKPDSATMKMRRVS